MVRAHILLTTHSFHHTPEPQTNNYFFSQRFRHKDQKPAVALISPDAKTLEPRRTFCGLFTSRYGVSSPDQHSPIPMPSSPCLSFCLNCCSSAPAFFSVCVRCHCSRLMPCRLMSHSTLPSWFSFSLKDAWTIILLSSHKEQCEVCIQFTYPNPLSSFFFFFF